MTAVCSGSEVTGVVSTGFATRRNLPPVPTVAWHPAIAVSAAVSAMARPGEHHVYVHCAGGSVARTSVTVG